MNYSKYVLLLCIALHVTSPVAVVVANDPLDPLNRRVGVWETKTTFKKAEWTPEERTTTGEETIKWILDNNFIQGDVVDTDGTNSHWLMNHDADGKVYRNWYFDNKNAFPRGDSTGRWDAKAERMDWEVDMGNGFRGQGNRIKSLA